MNFKLSMINWLNCIWESDLPSNSKYLACYLRKFMNENQDMAWPSYTRMINETGLARSTIAKYLEILEDRNWIQRDKGCSNKNTTYHAIFPPVIEATVQKVNDCLGSTRDEPRSTRDELHVVRETNSNKQSNKQVNKQNNIVSNETKLVEKAFNFIWQETSNLKKEFPNGGMGSKKKAKQVFEKLFNKDYFKKHTEEDFKNEVNDLFDLINREAEYSLHNLKSGNPFIPFERKMLTSILNAEEWRN